ncbi:MAG: outer membrane lipoprotein-sorting protein [Mariprofundaceae bacterium]
MYRWMIALLLLWPAAAAAETAEEKGLAIAMESERLDTGFGDSSARLLMVLRNRHGEEATRQIHNKTLEVEGDGDKSLVVFDEPRDVKGTAFLSFTHKSGPDDQWLYLPALKRVKRISSANKSGAFMGSEFAFEDIASQEVEKYAYRYLRDDVYEGRDCFVVERDPVDPNSGYSYQEVWFDKAHYRPFKVEYYDRKRAHLKTLSYSGYQQYLDEFWRADEFFMLNHQTGKSTRLVWTDYKFRDGLSEADFTRNSLKRAR